MFLTQCTTGVEATTPARLAYMGSQQQRPCEHTEEQCIASEVEENSKGGVLDATMLEVQTQVSEESQQRYSVHVPSTGPRAN